MKTYYDRLKETFQFYESNILPPSAQLIMLYLLHFNNCFGNTGQFYLSDNRLSLLTNLSKGAITNAKRVLKNIGLIDFKTNKSSPRQGTLYILPEEFSTNNWAKNWVKRGQNWGKPWGTSSPMLADNSTSISNNNIKKERDIDGEGERAYARGKPPPPSEKSCSEKVRLAWVRAKSVNPNAGISEKLCELEKKHGTENVVKAIEQANFSDDGFNGINLNFVISKLNQIVYGKKGEVKNGRSGDNDRTQRTVEAWNYGE